MIGDQYLQTRAQLGTALFSLSTLAHGLHAGRDMLQTLQDLRSDLREPFLIMVAGEEKSGKSSLINALFGREIVPIAEPPARDKIHVYKYGVEAQEVPAYDQFIEHFLPDTLLRDFNIVDTPASSTITHQQLAVVDQLLPEADLVLFVYSITNPWSASSREFLSHISAHQPRNAMFVLQQCDLRDALEVEAVVAHLQQIIGERFPDGNRVFPVSAKKAFLAKTDAADKEGLFQQSYFGPLESYIDDTAFNSGPRADTLRTGCQSAQIILGMLAEKTRNAHAAIRRDIGILTELNAELEERRAQAVRLAGGVQWAVAQSYDRVQKLGEEILQQKAKTAAKGGIDEKMEESMTGQIRHAMELLEADMLQTWPQFHEIVLKRFPPGNMAEQPGDLISERAQLLLQIDTAVAGKKSPEYFGRQAPQWFAD
ncbi:MAG TPA: dynamin family protein, partial [Chthoniobacteraceae bacterium]|nr:dynamin family protein [Chthoniobacteraceae bacterium]